MGAEVKMEMMSPRDARVSHSKLCFITLIATHGDAAIFTPWAQGLRNWNQMKINCLRNTSSFAHSGSPQEHVLSWALHMSPSRTQIAFSPLCDSSACRTQFNKAPTMDLLAGVFERTFSSPEQLITTRDKRCGIVRGNSFSTKTTPRCSWKCVPPGASFAAAEQRQKQREANPKAHESYMFPESQRSRNDSVWEGIKPPRAVETQPRLPLPSKNCPSISLQTMTLHHLTDRHLCFVLMVTVKQRSSHEMRWFMCQWTVKNWKPVARGDSICVSFNGFCWF